MGEEGTWKSFEFCGDEKLGGGSSFLRLRKGSFDFVDGVDRQKGRRNLLFWCTKSTADHLQNYTTHKKKEKKKKQEEEGTTTSSLSSSSSSSSSLLFFSYILKLHKEEELQELLLLQQEKLHQQLQALWALLVLCRFVRGDGFWSCKCCCSCCKWIQNKASKVTLCLLLLLQPKKHLLLCIIIIIIILVQNHNSLTRILFVCGDACLNPQTYWFLLCRFFWLFLLCPRVWSVVEWFFAWKLASDVSSQIGYPPTWWRDPNSSSPLVLTILEHHLYLCNISLFSSCSCSSLSSS